MHAKPRVGRVEGEAKMREPIKVGDRVRVYGFGQNPLAIVVNLEPDGNLKVTWLTSKGSWSVVHPKQCRRLKPRRERRSLWVEFYKGHDTGSVSVSTTPIDGWTEFREVRERK